MGGFPNQNSMFPNGQTQNQPTNPNLISNQTQNLQNSQKSNSDRYAALAELDTEIKQNQIQRQQIIKLYFRINLWFLNTFFFIICKKAKGINFSGKCPRVRQFLVQHLQVQIRSCRKPRRPRKIWFRIHSERIHFFNSSITNIHEVNMKAS